MSEKSKQNRKRREEQQQKQAEKVIKWIFGIMIALALCYAIYTFTQF